LKGSYSTGTGKSWNFKSHFPGLGSPGIRPKSWNVNSWYDKFFDDLSE